MIKKMKNYLIIVASIMPMILPMALPAVSHAAAGGATACQGVPNTVASGAGTAGGAANNDVGCTTNNPINGTTQTTVGTIANTIVNIFSVIVGAASILMIIYSGFRYITSGGSSERIGSAKTTLIYAIIGLIVVALAQILVHFVLSTAISTSNQLQ